jgi:hypothetical protein
MVVLWFLGVYFTNDIVIKIQNEQIYHIHLQRLRGSLDLFVNHLKNVTNTTVK